MTEKEREKLFAYLLNESMRIDSQLDYAASVVWSERSVYAVEQLHRAAIRKHYLDKLIHDLYALFDL